MGLLGLLVAVARSKGASADWAFFAFVMWWFAIGQFSP
jgi:hypothetical protein